MKDRPTFVPYLETLEGRDLPNAALLGAYEAQLPAQTAAFVAQIPQTVAAFSTLINSTAGWVSLLPANQQAAGQQQVQAWQSELINLPQTLLDFYNAQVAATEAALTALP